MPFRWNKMEMRDYASFQRLMGIGVVKVRDGYWSAVRPYFYRPIWPLQELSPDTVVLPRRALLGGAQYAVAPGSPSNSHLNLIIFDEIRAYTPDSLHRNERRQIRLASRDFVVRQITDVEEFKRDAFPAYLSFYSRTQYQVGAERKDRAFFSRWADRLFAIPNVLVLGGYRGNEVGAVSLSFVLGDTLNYASFFCDAPALKMHISDLMLHTLREAAAKSDHINRIFMGMFKGDPGLDDFKFHRGAKLCRLPARLEINPFTRSLIHKLLPRQYQQLTGQLPVQKVDEHGVKA